MKRLYVAYNKRSCKTGRALFEKLKALGVRDCRIRRSSRRPQKKPDIVLRWGSAADIGWTGTIIDPNTQEGVRNASNKLAMIRILADTEGVSVPEVRYPGQGRLPSGDWFVRNFHHQIRDRNNFISGDLYAVKAIDKVMELRVHVFNGRVVGVYEKVPQTEGVRIYKDDNCTFTRLGVDNSANRQRIIGARPMAKKAVEAMGLLYGGVDVVKDSGGNWYVLEVNSAPGLNEPNLDRWATLLKDYIENEVL